LIAVGEAAGLVASAVDVFQIGAFTMNKLHNPWRDGAFSECVTKLEKAGVRQPKAFELIAEIIDRIGKIEREDARRAEAREFAQRFNEQKDNPNE
jgi:hypothetical protein